MAAGSDDPGMTWLLFSPSGRIGRYPYLMSLVFWIFLQAAAVALMFRYEHNDGRLALATLALLLLCLASIVSTVMLTIKRVHDMGYPAIAAFLLFIPVVSFAAFAAFLFWPSAPPNDFGQRTNRPK